LTSSAGPAPGGQRFPVRLLLPVQWGEMDAYGHVNNAVYFRWFESARMAYFARLGWPELERESGVGPILHSTQARFRAPLHWPDEVEVGASAGEVLEDRFTMRYEVRSRRLDRLAAEGSGLIVAFDYRAQAKTRLPDPVRERLAALEAEGGRAE
jgi:acyl-CoA thioester hydrolase